MYVFFLDINLGLNHNKMHFLSNFKGPTSLGYKHRGPIHPIVQHIFIMNINNVVHKLIGWKGKNKSPSNWRAPIKDLLKKIARWKEFAKLKDRFQLKKKKKEFSEILWDYDGTFRNGSSLLVTSNEFIAHFIWIWRPLAFQIRPNDFLLNFEVICVKQ